MRLRLSAFCWTICFPGFSQPLHCTGRGDSESGTAPIYTISAPKMCNSDILQSEIRATKRCATGNWRHSKAFKNLFSGSILGLSLRSCSLLLISRHLETFRESKTLRGLRPTLSLCRIHWSFLSSTTVQHDSSWWVSETFRDTRHATSLTEKYSASWLLNLVVSSFSKVFIKHSSEAAQQETGNRHWSDTLKNCAIQSKKHRAFFVHGIYVSLVEVDEKDNVIPEARHSCPKQEQQRNWEKGTNRSWASISGRIQDLV